MSEGVLKILGEDNVEQLKAEIVKLIINQFEQDLEERYTHEYMFEPDEIANFIDKCKEEAFEKVHDDIVASFENKIRNAI